MRTHGLLAEFDHPDQLFAAITRLRELGYRDLDAYTPYPIHGLDEALGIGRSPVPKLMLLGALVGGTGAYVLQWWMSAVDYPLNVGGRPPHSAPAFVPITFEMAILFAGLTGFLSLFVLSNLPRLWHPVFDAEGFESASIDKFWLSIDARDPRFDRERTRAELEALGPRRVVWPGRGDAP